MATTEAMVAGVRRCAQRGHNRVRRQHQAQDQQAQGSIHIGRRRFQVELVDVVGQ